jgi:acyl carrier protein
MTPDEVETLVKSIISEYIPLGDPKTISRNDTLTVDLGLDTVFFDILNDVEKRIGEKNFAVAEKTIPSNDIATIYTVGALINCAIELDRCYTSMASDVKPHHIVSPSGNASAAAPCATPENEESEISRFCKNALAAASRDKISPSTLSDDNKLFSATFLGSRPNGLHVGKMAEAIHAIETEYRIALMPDNNPLPVHTVGELVALVTNVVLNSETSVPVPRIVPVSLDMGTTLAPSPKP